MSGTQEGPRLCSVCGKPIPKGERRRRYCSVVCAEEGERRRARDPYEGKPKSGIYIWRICTDCGTKFYGHIKSFRCPTCAREAEMRNMREYHRRKDAGKARPIGSTDICENCGKPYTVNSGRQRYCPECAHMMWRKHQREASIAWNRKAYADTKKHAERNESRRQKSPMEGRCPVCGKPIQATAGKVYCSEACRMAAVRERDRERKRKKAEETQRNRPPVPFRRCPVCGKEFAPVSPRAIYCSQKCKSKHSNDKRRNKQKNPIDT